MPYVSALYRAQFGDTVYALYVCLICMPYMYASYVCMPYIYRTQCGNASADKRPGQHCVCLTSMPYMYALYVCLICMPHMYVCLIYTEHSAVMTAPIRDPDNTVAGVLLFAVCVYA